MADSDSIKLCERGCGKPAPISTHNRPDRGQTKGQPVRFISGHNRARTTHGYRHTATYRSWQAMLTRCHNPRGSHWPRYGGRGISVCDRWLKFENFLADMGERPATDRAYGISLDRIDNDGNYEPGNCCWRSQQAQCRNKSNNLVIEHNGERRCAAEWAEIFGIDQKLLQKRFHKGEKPPHIFRKPSPL